MEFGNNNTSIRCPKLILLKLNQTTTGVIECLEFITLYTVSQNGLYKIYIPNLVQSLKYIVSS